MFFCVLSRLEHFFLSIKQKNQKLYTYKLVVLTELLTPGIGFKALIFGNNETPPTPAFIKGVEDGMLLFGKIVDGICGNVGWNNGTWLICGAIGVEVIGKIGAVMVVFKGGSIKSELGVEAGRIAGPFGLVKTFLIK